MVVSNPNRSAGLRLPDPIAARGSVPELSLDYEDLNKENSFIVTYFPVNSSVSRKFHFALLPAIESQLQYGGGGSLRGQQSVPEVKPGVVTDTNVRVKSMLIPGSTPVVQSIGVSNTTHQLVGTFIGSEGDSKPTLNPIYPVSNDPPWSDSKNSFVMANFFNKEVVQSICPVIIDIQSDVKYRYEGIIMHFKFYAVRADRTYYVLDILKTDYS